MPLMATIGNERRSSKKNARQGHAWPKIHDTARYRATSQGRKHPRVGNLHQVYHPLRSYHVVTNRQEKTHSRCDRRRRKSQDNESCWGLPSGRRRIWWTEVGACHNQYRREILTHQDEEYKAWNARFPNCIGELAQTPEDVEKAHLLLATWKDIFVENIRDTPRTDLIEHRILRLPFQFPVHHQQLTVPPKTQSTHHWAFASVRCMGPSKELLS